MAEASETVTLTVDGQRHDGWTSVSVTRAIDTLCGEFTLGLTERWADRPQAFDLEAGSACTVAVAGETVITGYIDRLSPSIDANGHAIEISGRDRAGDLVDCSAIAKPGSWADTSIEAIASELAKPFGITVSARASTGPNLKRFALQQGESVQAAIERLCRFAGLLAISTAEGNVELIAPETGGVTERFVMGDNILSASAAYDATQRFSEYVLKGQASGDEAASGKTVAAPSATATDPGVKRHRPLMVIAEEQATLANLGVRAKWEASTRAGRGKPVTIVAPGWRAPSGKLRDRNTIVAIDAPQLFADGAMLVQSVTYRLDASGTTTELVLVPPEAWSQMAVPEASAVSRVGAKAKAKGKAK